MPGHIIPIHCSKLLFLENHDPHAVKCATTAVSFTVTPITHVVFDSPVRHICVLQGPL
jgi:hypothetical protein